MNRIKRKDDPVDDGGCRRCGECCMVLEICRISDDEVSRLGIEFCYSVEPNWLGGHGIKMVPRTWAPKFAHEGVCVFLFPGENGFECMARDERPRTCSEFRCTSDHWAPLMDYKTAEMLLHVEKDSLKSGELKRRREELNAAHERAGL